MKVTIAYIDEPPFGWTEVDGAATGADIELADTVLRALGVSKPEHHLTTFGELLSGVESGRWDMTVPLFVTPERSARVAFSVPVWAIGDGFLVRAGNPKGLMSYASFAERQDARLGIILGQVQHDAAKVSGVSDDQIVVFEHQHDAIAALRSGEIDAYASTALGNRMLANRGGISVFEAVQHESESSHKQQNIPLGAFSFSKRNSDLLAAVNRQLRFYLGSPEHRARMATFGLTHNEIDPAIICQR
ncbi:transporter substrate-binding domain-containing protein [Paraburkholderia sp. DHOC27]|uniref:transporter substrate-binding domain-containing protein n=1 Tax=Paraburkholderia sp. DHOC27 TaxID=2303330 RepID=UPI000E3E8492|nr:transporter substrate-binding domain-containing protein [Paraburkholderia sp. DHOC27]RFU44456.1 amino acid ABC transporter substrate-binding protein [Paraburkholderia sp. DHOC27]